MLLLCMKNIKYNTHCHSCNNVGYFCTTPFGGDYTTCGSCGSFCKRLSDENDDYIIINDEIVEYCSNCKIITFVGCLHSENGCTSSVFNAHFISEWLDKKTEEKFYGMPQFENLEECLEKINDIEIISFVCPNYGLHCNNGYYPKSKYPEYYKKCLLCE